MNRLKEVFEDLAHDAPPIGDIAQRTMERARRRRWFNLGGSVTAAAGLAVAGVTAVALVVAGLPGSSPPEGKQEVRPAASSEPARHFRLPEATPAPLPERATGQVTLAYTLNCSGATDREDCASWRVLTADGKHWRLADAMSAGPRGGGGPGSGPLKVWTQPSGLAVSPDGRSIAYFREDGTFGIRDLRTGEFRAAYRETKSSQVSWGTVAVVWSADGSRVAVSYAFAGSQVAARVVDRESMRTTRLPVSCCVLGLPGGSGDLLMFEAEGSSRPRDLLVVGPDGSVRRKVPFDDLIALTDDARIRYRWSLLSPDGRSIVGLFDEDQAPLDEKEPDGIEGTLQGHESDMQLQVASISASTGAVGARHPVSHLRGLGYTDVLGWSGPSELLAADLTGSIYDEVKADDARFAGGTVYAVNITTGATRQAVSFAGGAEPTLLSLATDLL